MTSPCRYPKFSEQRLGRDSTMSTRSAEEIEYDDWSSVVEDDGGESRSQPSPRAASNSVSPPKEKSLVLSGKLENMPLPDLAQTLASNRKTGMVEIISGIKTGKVAFLNGAVVGGWADQLRGAAAVYRLLGYNDGDFAFYAQAVDTPGSPEEQPGLPCGAQGLLMEGMRHIDEVERTLREIPGPNVVLALPATPQGDEIFSLSEAALTLFTSIESDTTYAELLLSSELCDIELVQAIKDLLAGGFLIALDQEREVPEIRLVPDIPWAGTVSVDSQLDVDIDGYKRGVVGKFIAVSGVLAGLAAIGWGMTKFGVLDSHRSAPLVAGGEMTGAAMPSAVGGTGGTFPGDSAEEGMTMALEPSCPDGMKLISAGKFFRGSQSEERIFASARPAHAVKLDAYCLDTFEVSVEKYRECSKSGNCERAHRQVWWPKPASKSVSEWKQERRALAEHCNENGEGRLKHPVNCVTWSQAKAYCERKGGRLPTEAEWEYAARGSDGRIFPWGDAKPSAKHLNGCGEECRQRREKDGLADITPMYPGDDGYATTAPIGSFPAGVGQWGHQDLIGNVFEWTADAFVPYEKIRELAADKHAVLENPVQTKGERRVIRGGAFNSYRSAFTNPALRGMMPAETRSHGIGFRCAADPVLK